MQQQTCAHRSHRAVDDGLVDVHCHILVGIDDGAPDVGAALELARSAAASGVRVIAATRMCALIIRGCADRAG